MTLIHGVGLLAVCMFRIFDTSMRLFTVYLLVLIVDHTNEQVL